MSGGILDRLTVAGGRIVDTAGRAVTLRGVVTLTAVNFGGPVELDEGHFDQIAGWGFNAQVVRLESARLGVLECEPDPSYLDKLDRWTTWAADRGIYTMFKMTTYDIPSLTRNTSFDFDVWQEFWDRPEWRQDRIEAWRLVWERFAGRPEVVGYDILNEPGPGRLSADEAADRLYAFYGDVAIALRKTDEAALLFAQPDIGTRWWRDVQGQPRHDEDETPHGRQRPIADPLVVYTPHFYSDMIKHHSREQYDAEVAGMVEEGGVVGGAVFVGEYGSPDAEQLLAMVGKVDERAAVLRSQYRTWNEREELDKGAALDRHGLGWIRPWYIDQGPWALLGPGYTETRKLEIVVRPYPERVQGHAPEWSFDYGDHRFSCVLDIDPAVAAPTIVVVQAARFYPDGVRILVDGDPAPDLSADLSADLSVAADRLVIPAGRLAAGRHTLELERTA